MKNKEKYKDLDYSDCSKIFKENFKHKCNGVCHRCIFHSYESFINFMNEELLKCEVISDE